MNRIEMIAKAILTHAETLEDVQALVNQTCRDVPGLAESGMLHRAVAAQGGYVLDGLTFSSKLN